MGATLLTSPEPRHLPKPPPNTNTLGVRVSTWEFGGHTTNQSSTHPIPFFWASSFAMVNPVSMTLANSYSIH